MCIYDLKLKPWAEEGDRQDLCLFTRLPALASQGMWATDEALFFPMGQLLRKVMKMFLLCRAVSQTSEQACLTPRGGFGDAASL